MNNKQTLPKLHKAWPKSIKLIILAIIIYFVWLFNSQYVTPLALGFILAVVTYPIYTRTSHRLSLITKKVFKKDWSFDSLAAIFTILVTSYIMIFLAQLMIGKVMEETPRLVTDTGAYINDFVQSDKLYNTASKMGISHQDVNNGKNQLLDKWEGFSSDLVTTDNATKIVDFGKDILGGIFTQLLAVIVFLLAWFNALTHGKNWIRKIFSILPFSFDEIDTIKERLKNGIGNVLYASLISATIHSLIVFSIMTAFDSPYVWVATLITFLVGILPMSAAEFGYIIPVTTAFNKNPFVGLLLIPLVETVIIYINYIFIPKFIASGGESSPLLILTSVLSGVYIFGIMGFIIGPVLMILVQTLWQILTEREALELK